MATIPTVRISANNAKGYKIVNADDPRAAYAAFSLEPRPSAQTLTRTDIARMKRGEVIDYMEAHGVSEADCEGVKLLDLRKRLAEIMFLDL